ncbi:MAG: hypothetical protein H6Q67_1249 [Firmicutes bacterium]|nr:hypothetical protein [Bacillota bacterium]
MVDSLLSFLAKELAARREEKQEYGDGYYVFQSFMRCQEEIKHVLPEEMHNLVDKMGNEYQTMCSIERETGYRQGFKDAIIQLIIECAPQEK